MQTSGVPARNPYVYCRFCLSQLNLLTVLESEHTNDPSLKQILQQLNSLAKVNLASDDFPSAICGICVAQLNEFYQFRKNVLRNHNLVRLFRRSNCDNCDIKPNIKELDTETTEEILIDILDYDSQMEAKDDNDGSAINSPNQAGPIVKDIDLYHIDGELKTLVVKQKGRSTVDKTTGKHMQNEDGKNPSPIIVIPFSDALLKKQPLQQRVAKPPVEKHAGQLPTRNTFLVVTCSSCNAVFRNRENLIIHMKNDHPDKDLEQNTSAPKIVVTPTKRCQQSNADQNVPHITLYKCTQCNSSFIQEANFKQHLKTCKLTALAKLDKSQITIKRTKNVAPKIQLLRNDPKSDRLRCSHCPSTYVSKYFLQKHLLEVHNISSSDKVYFCKICLLNYSCAEDLKLHNQALHPFRCNKCGEDYRKCMHAQQSTKPVFHVNKVKAN
ncbi:zinc finger protein ZFP2-like [Sabethes cyaneus]|uniref:zinc finger protein ZFP2-like n=1 Tax=Sabethes cyaneus TaxID=53552 RepID=UPI00237E8F08|nr:zinc finger protein ZFP2-like [Sabethes cyaneus]